MVKYGNELCVSKFSDGFCFNFYLFGDQSIICNIFKMTFHLKAVGTKQAVCLIKMLILPATLFDVIYRVIQEESA